MKKLELIENIEFIIIFLIIFLPVRFFIFEPFVVVGESMEPNFHSADYLIICKVCIKLGAINRYDVVIFKPPVDESKYYIKRVIGLPGERVYLRGNEVYIYNKENPKGFKLEESYLKEKNFYMEEQTFELNDDEYFVLGDNREESYDSRKWGPLKKERIIGKVILRIDFLSRLIKVIHFRKTI